MQQRAGYSITSSARTSRAVGKVMPSVVAVLRLIASSTFTACMIEANLSQCITQARAVAHQTAGHNEFTQRVDRGQNVASRERDEHFRSVIEKPVRSQKKASDPLLHEGRESRFDITFDNGFGNNQFTPNRIRRRLDIRADGVRIGIGRIFKHADDRGLGHSFVQHPKLLWGEFTPEEGHARDVAAWPS